MLYIFLINRLGELIHREGTLIHFTLGGSVLTKKYFTILKIFRDKHSDILDVNDDEKSRIIK